MNMPKIVAPVRRSVLSQTKENENNQGGIQASDLCSDLKAMCARGHSYACQLSRYCGGR